MDAACQLVQFSSADEFKIPGVYSNWMFWLLLCAVVFLFSGLWTDWFSQLPVGSLRINWKIFRDTIFTVTVNTVVQFM